jgi:hypothetical protein
LRMIDNMQMDLAGLRAILKGNWSFGFKLK